MTEGDKNMKLLQILLEQGDSKDQQELKEYITNDVISLRDYFSMPKSSKMKYLPHEYYYLFDDFLEQSDIYFERPEDFDDDFELMTWLEKNNTEVYNSFAEYLYDGSIKGTLNISDAEYPAWAFFDNDPKLIKNQWLIHFTNDAYGIASGGFKYGVDDMSKLGLTTHLGEFDKKYGGYNFAYTLSDFQKYGSDGRSRYKYGNEAVIFNASGIKLWHFGDEEPQVIFYGNTAKNIIPITRGDYSQFGVYSKNGKLLYESDYLPDVVKWVVDNYQQYRKNFVY